MPKRPKGEIFMNKLLCEFLEVKEHVRQYNGSKYYSVRVLFVNKTHTMFFNKVDLFEKFSKIDRMTPITIFYDLRIKEDGNITLIPEAFEI